MNFTDPMSDFLIGIVAGMWVMLALVCLILLKQSRQAWISLDQWVHCLCYDDAMSDETFSARCWRESQDKESSEKCRAKWARRVRWIDAIFGKGHCLAAFEAELNHKQLPPGYYHG